MTLDDFHATYLDDGQPVQYSASVSYVDGLAGRPQNWRLEVNHPLRLDGANVYLLGHGYAPILRYTDRYGVVQTAAAPFLPEDPALTSVGVVKFLDANVPPGGSARDNPAQMAFSGVYLPTMPVDADGTLSAYPGERDPGPGARRLRGEPGTGLRASRRASTRSTTTRSPPASCARSPATR